MFFYKCLSFELQLDSIKILVLYAFNSLPNYKSLDWSKIKAFADDKINVTEKLKSGLGRTENIAEKGKKCLLPAFSQS